MGKGGKSSGVAAAARGDPKGAKGAKDPVKPKARKPTAAEKDEAKLQDLHLVAKGNILFVAREAGQGQTTDGQGSKG